MGAIRLRRTVNWVNLSTPLGLLIGRAGRATFRRGPHGLILATSYRLRVPAPNAPAITIGDVVLLRMSYDDAIARGPMLDHESRHAVQYAFWVGMLGFLPAYLIASAWSWWHTGTFALRNGFEVNAGLADGGYVRAPGSPGGQDRRPGQAEV